MSFLDRPEAFSRVFLRQLVYQFVVSCTKQDQIVAPVYVIWALATSTRPQRGLGYYMALFSKQSSFAFAFPFNYKEGLANGAAIAGSCPQ